MKKPLQILHIEDSQEDSELVQSMLEKNGLTCDFKRVETRTDTFDELQKGSYDLILSDCSLPHFSGLGALEIAQALRPEVPFIFVSGTIGEEAAIESLRNGATDYVMKQRLTKLIPAVRRALNDAEERALVHQMQERLHEAGRLEAISTLSNGIAHDFNNILTIILGHASLLSVEYDRPERVLELTGTITEAARRASNVVKQLMAFAHKSEGVGISTDLNRWIEATLGQLNERLPSRVEILFEPAGDLPLVVVDGEKLERILDSLIANAIDSMPAGGGITLSTEVVPAASLPDLLSQVDSDTYVCMKVTDTGRGMDPETRAHVFEPFYTTKERGRGTGLGLPVVYGLMQAQNGYITVESEPGRGTEISLFFPVPKPNPRKNRAPGRGNRSYAVRGGNDPRGGGRGRRRLFYRGGSQEARLPGRDGA